MNKFRIYFSLLSILSITNKILNLIILEFTNNNSLKTDCLSSN